VSKSFIKEKSPNIKKMPEWLRRFRLPWVPAGVEYDDPIGRHCPCKTRAGQVKLGKREKAGNVPYRKKTRGVRRIIREKKCFGVPNKGLMIEKRKPPPSAEFVDYGSCVNANK
jgi:hypothetical protein